MISLKKAMILSLIVFGSTIGFSNKVLAQYDYQYMMEEVNPVNDEVTEFSELLERYVALEPLCYQGNQEACQEIKKIQEEMAKISNGY